MPPEEMASVCIEHGGRIEVVTETWEICCLSAPGPAARELLQMAGHLPLP